MEKNSSKGNNIIVILLVLVIIILGGALYLSLTGTLKLENSKTNTINSSTEKSGGVITEEKDNSEVTTKQKESNLLDLSKLDKYKNYDGSYGEMVSYYELDDTTNINYSIKLTLDNKVKACIGHECSELTNVKDVIDIKEMNIAGTIDLIKYYILDDKGNVYYYELGNIKNSIFTVAKVDKVSSVKSLFNFSYFPKKNAGGVWGIIAITENNEYIELDKQSV